MSSFVGLYTGLSGVRAAQTGIDVTSNNVANANTLGYTRQRVELIASPSYGSPVGRLGTGVSVGSVARLRDVFLDDRFRSAVADLGFGAVRAETLTSLESLAGEPDDGISVRLDRLWDAAEAWANDPADAATRRQVLSELSSVSEVFRSTAASWDRLEQDLVERRDTTVDTVNATLATLHDLDRRIAGADPSRVGPDLLDQRDVLLDQLAALTGATARIQSDGSTQVQLGGVDLLSPDGPATVSVTGNGIVVTPQGGAPTDVSAGVRGELGGLQNVVSVELPSWRARLDDLASGIATAINEVNAAGGGPPLLGFDDPDDPAGTLRLLTDDTADLAASTAGPGAPPGDASNARRFADLRTQPVDFPDGPRTIDGQLADLVIGLAGEVRASRAAASAAGGVATGATLARAAEHGVSLDEEMVGLVQYQRALEASARVMTTVDQALETLVNRVGIVGR